jgi:beta-1,4-N-acetylglucosaminyltransferase
MSLNNLGKFCFVTVGSTSFDALVAAVDTSSVLQTLKSQGYDCVVFQIGQGKYIPKQQQRHEIIRVEYFRRQPSIEVYLREAAFVICHAGVGTVMETLRLKQQVVVVVNPSLMDNHQLEVAEALHCSQHIHLCRKPSKVDAVLAGISPNSKLVPIPDLDTSLFPALLEEELSLVVGWKSTTVSALFVLLCFSIAIVAAIFGTP